MFGEDVRKNRGWVGVKVRNYFLKWFKFLGRRVCFCWGVGFCCSVRELVYCCFFNLGIFKFF